MARWYGREKNRPRRRCGMNRIRACYPQLMNALASAVAFQRRFFSLIAAFSLLLLLPAVLRADAPTTKKSAAPSATQASVAGAKANFPDATPEVVTAVTRKVFPAVVRIDVAQETYSEGKRTLRRGIGSGVIIDQKGR